MRRKEPPGKPALRNLDLPRLRARYRLMLRIRALEETALRGMAERVVLGAIHPSIGQEAVAAGVVGSLARDDILLSTHRGHGHTLAKGAAAEAMIRELLGRVGGTCGGKGGSMHIADFSVGMLGANGVVGANIVIAAGAAHAIRLRGERRVVCLHLRRRRRQPRAVSRRAELGGASSSCRSSSSARTTATPRPRRTARDDRGRRAGGARRGARDRGEEVDGNDVLAVDGAAREAIAAIRAGGGPRSSLAHTYRLTRPHRGRRRRLSAGRTRCGAARARPDRRAPPRGSREAGHLERGWRRRGAPRGGARQRRTRQRGGGTVAR